MANKRKRHEAFTTLNIYHSSDEGKDREKPTLADIIESLGLAKIWSVIGAVAMLLYGAYDLGVKHNSLIMKSELAKEKLKSEQLMRDNDELKKKNQLSSKKREFEVRLNRVKKTKAIADQSPSDNSLQEAKEQAERELACFLDKNVDSDKDENGIPILTVKLGETRAQSKIQFWDGTLYDVPESVKDKKKSNNFDYLKQKTGALENFVRYSPKNNNQQRTLPNELPDISCTNVDAQGPGSHSRERGITSIEPLILVGSRPVGIDIRK
jgi:hypothetical protein